MPGTGKFQPHLFAPASLPLWWRMVREYGGVPPRYWGRLAGVLALSAATAPLRLAERLRYGRRIAHTEIRQPPIFIQGFARSGTTHLHNLMAQDPELGYVSTMHAFASTFFLISRGWMDQFIVRQLPSKRPMDNMAVSLDLPQEEEVPLAAITRLSGAHQLSFPGRAQKLIEKMGTMQLTETEMQEWTDSYLHVLRKATLASDGRRLVLKAPSNLGRTALLHSLFPGAKFIFIVRNPYIVFSSTMNLHRTMIPLYQLQDANWDDMEASVLYNYADMTRQYMKDRTMLPEGSLIEVRFEDLDSDAMGVLERIYTELDLSGWKQAQQPIQDYLGTLSGYRKNRYHFDQSLIDRVNEEWGFAVREWGYQPPDCE